MGYGPAVEGGCARPVQMRDASTGETVCIRCGTRSQKTCPSCAKIYKGDTSKIIRSGIVPTGYMYFFLTLTAPSFGRCHMVPKRGERKRCACGAWHDPVRDIDLRGVPLDGAHYDYLGQARFNYCVGRLWDATRSTLSQTYPGMDYVKIYEWQRRGALHVHVMIRIPVMHRSADAIAADMLARARAVVAMGGAMRWGAQCRCDVLKGKCDVDRHIGYVKKTVSYICKDVCEVSNGSDDRSAEHVRRLDWAARRMQCDRCRERMAQVRAEAGGDLVTTMRVVSVMEPCHALPHRRWGARAGVMSVSRHSTRHEGWSLTGLTRRLLAHRRMLWWRQKYESDAMHMVTAALDAATAVAAPE